MADWIVVVDDDMRYLWMRARPISRTPLRIDPEALGEGEDPAARCLRAVLSVAGVTPDVESLLRSGQTPREIMENSLRDSEFIDLTGCGVTACLYYIGKGAPVYAADAAQGAVLLTGYDTSTVYVYDSGTGEAEQLTYEEAEERFAAAGNTFYTYLEME